MIGPSRRSALASLAALSAASVARAAALPELGTRLLKLGPATPFTFDRLRLQARRLAAQPFSAPHAPPAELAHAIDYDAFNRIVFRPAATLWGDAPGGVGVQFFPVGRPAPRPVAMNVVDQGRARPILYSADLFTSPAESALAALGQGAGFGGFRVMNDDRRTDWLSFLGASYFRSSDPFNQYGLSARAIAIDTATSGPEEFPAFVAFWIEAPKGGAPPAICALLDGPSLVGAWRFVHSRPGAGLVQEVTAELHFRRTPARLGLAPLTSMYWYGESDRAPPDDWRPQIHDSDGLAIWTGAGERIWRPLANPGRVRVNAFFDRGPRGFGLMQRDRSFADYEDDGVRYDRRPSVWVEPIGDWGAGSVQLVEIPTSGEADDNIVAFWSPARPPAQGESLAFAYRLHWCDEEPTPPGVARAVATRFGRGGRPGQPVPPGRRKYVVDFAGQSLAGLARADGVEPVVTLGQGAAIDPVAYPVAGSLLWRLMFDIEPTPGRTLDLRAYLRRGAAALTETWIDQLDA